MIASASWVGRRVETIQYGTGSAGSSKVSSTAVFAYGRSTRWARASASGPVRRVVASGSNPRTAET